MGLLIRKKCQNWSTSSYPGCEHRNTDQFSKRYYDSRFLECKFDYEDMKVIVVSCLTKQQTQFKSCFSPFKIKKYLRTFKSIKSVW